MFATQHICFVSSEQGLNLILVYIIVYITYGRCHYHMTSVQSTIIFAALFHVEHLWWCFESHVKQNCLTKQLIGCHYHQMSLSKYFADTINHHFCVSFNTWRTYRLCFKNCLRLYSNKYNARYVRNNVTNKKPRHNVIETKFFYLWGNHQIMRYINLVIMVY